MTDRSRRAATSPTPNCTSRHYPRPVGLQQRQRVAVYGLLLSERHVLLVRSSRLSALPDRWFLPGGGLDFGETPQAAVVREFQEESGLTVAPTALRDVVSEVTDLPERGERLHTVRVIYDVCLLGGTLRAELGGTTEDVRWVALSEVRDLPLMPFVQAQLPH